MSDVIYQQIVLQVSGAAPGQKISVQLTPNGSNIGFSTGPDFQSSGGIQIVAQTGNLPLSQLNVNASQATFLTSASGGGSSSSLSFNVTAFFVADPSISTFYLRSSSDPGISVQVQIGNALPQVVNQTDTLFSWNQH